MWSSTTLRSCSSRHVPSSSPRRVIGNSVRYLSNNEHGGRGGGRGTGRRSSGRGGRGGRGEGSLNRFRESRHAKKQNFAKTVLEPAARGELQKNHQSGIPKLVARKGKSHKVHDEFAEMHKTTQDLVDGATFPNDEEQDGAMMMDSISTEGGNRRNSRVRVTYASPSSPPKEEEAFYDSEDEFDIMQEDEMIHDLTDHDDIVPNDDGTYTLYYNPEEYFGPSERRNQGGHGGGDDADYRDPEAAYYLRRFWDNPNMETERIPSKLYNRVLPLAKHGPEMEDFLDAHLEHPARYAEVTRYNHHPEYEREGKPAFPKNRVQPTEEFVTSHKRFLFVSGLPHFVREDGEPGDFENPVDHYEVIKVVADIFGVEPHHVSPSSMTSAFIGYTDKQKFYDTQRNGPSRHTFAKPIIISKYSGSDNEEFVAGSDAVVELKCIPPGTSAGKLSHVLFPAGTEVGSVYGPLTMDQILMTSPTTALIRLNSAEQAESAISSEMLESHVQELGLNRVRYFKARREIVFAKFGGPNNCREMKQRGLRLIVDGDAPSQEFYRTHAGVIHLRGLDTSVTKKDLSDMFQPFSLDRRDVTGSVEFVKCAEGLRTDHAYVGFDILGEAEEAVKSCSGLFQIGSTRVVIRTVKDKHQFRLQKEKTPEPRESRPMRSDEDIVDSLNNWEKFVDPKEIEELEQLGIRKEVLDNAFRTMRYHNKTFGPTDLALTRERLVPERAAGDDYRETVREYINTLKECMATPEDPGLIYKSLFFPNEEVDLSFFDIEKERQAKLKEKYEGSTS